MVRKSQAERAYIAIKQQIIDKKIAIGQPILETELAKGFHMSRTPVREAIKRLTAEGHLETIKGKGTYLRAMTPDQIINCYELSEGLEGMLAFHLAERCKEGNLDDKGLDKLDDLIAKMDKAGADDDIPLWIDLDTSFHSDLHRLCDNPFLLESLDRLQTHFDSVSLFAVPLYHRDTKDIANSEHRDMVRYIREGNPVKARVAAQNQRLRIRTILKKLTRRG